MCGNYISFSFSRCDKKRDSNVVHIVYNALFYYFTAM